MRGRPLSFPHTHVTAEPVDQRLHSSLEHSANPVSVWRFVPAGNLNTEEAQLPSGKRKRSKAHDAREFIKPNREFIVRHKRQDLAVQLSCVPIDKAHILSFVVDTGRIGSKPVP